MPATFKVTLKIRQGDTYNKLFTWKVGTPSALVDLTGCTARMQIREYLGAPDALLTLTTENGRIELGGAAGTIRLLLEAADTAALTIRRARYDLDIIFADGTQNRKLEGFVIVSPEVTTSV